MNCDFLLTKKNLRQSAFGFRVSYRLANMPRASFVYKIRTYALPGYGAEYADSRPTGCIKMRVSFTLSSAYVHPIDELCALRSFIHTQITAKNYVWHKYILELI
jgi:hypothetical protein